MAKSDFITITGKNGGTFRKFPANTLPDRKIAEYLTPEASKGIIKCLKAYAKKEACLGGLCNGLYYGDHDFGVHDYARLMFDLVGTTGPLKGHLGGTHAEQEGRRALLAYVVKRLQNLHRKAKTGGHAPAKRLRSTGAVVLGDEVGLPSETAALAVETSQAFTRGDLVYVAEDDRKDRHHQGQVGVVKCDKAPTCAVLYVNFPGDPDVRCLKLHNHFNPDTRRKVVKLGPEPDRDGFKAGDKVYVKVGNGRYLNPGVYTVSSVDGDGDLWIDHQNHYSCISPSSRNRAVYRIPA